LEGLHFIHGTQVRSFTLREERSLKVFENKMLRRIFGLKRDEVTGEWEKNYTMRSLVIRSLHQTLFG
jgi:hypothetical protein